MVCKKDNTIPCNKRCQEIPADLRGVAERLRLRTFRRINEDAPNLPLMRPTEAGSRCHVT
jgi:hypothetical protein